MSSVIKRKERLQIGFVVLVIIICLLLIKLASVNINSIQATSEPFTEISRNNTEVSELKVVEKPQQQITEESTSIATEEASSESELLERPNFESLGRFVSVLVAARETGVGEKTEVVGGTEGPDAEAVAKMKTEEAQETFEPEVVEEPQQQIIEESTSVAAEEASLESELLEELESIESSELTHVAERETEVVEEAESDESLGEPESWIAEDSQDESAVESTFVVTADPKPEPDMIEEPDLDVIVETESRAIEGADAKVVAEIETEETQETFEPEVIEEPQQQIIEESTSVAAEEASSEWELLEELESVESSEPVLVAEHEMEVVEEPQQQIIEESTSVTAEEASSESELLEELESVESSEPILVAEREMEATEEAESDESFGEPESWIAEDSQDESAVESTFVVTADPKPEPDMIEEPDLEVTEENKIRAERIDTEVFEEAEPEDTLVAYELEVVEEPQQQIIEESTSVVAEEESSESELLEELESVESSEPVLVAQREMEVVEEAESDESLDEPESWIAEDSQDESTAESTFLVVADPKPEPDMIEEPDSEVTEENEIRAIEGIDSEVFAEAEPEEILVTYELEVVEEPRKEIVEEQESVSPLLHKILAESKTTDVERPTTPTTESIKASGPKVTEESQIEVSVIKEETDSVSLRLANIFSGKGELAVVKEPHAATTKDVKPPDKKASEPEAVEKPRQESVEKKKSVFSYLQEVFKKLKR